MCSIRRPARSGARWRCCCESIRSAWCGAGAAVGSFALAEYVNDRPYVASSFMSVALVTVFKSAMAGTCKGHEELAGSRDPLEASLPVVPARGGEALVRRLFEPLGYEVDVAPIVLDPQFPSGGTVGTSACACRASVRLADLLTHLYVLLPVLDDDKHYWVDEAEIEKLMRRGEGWLGAHPERDLIVRRYLKQQAQPVLPGAGAARRGGTSGRGARRARGARSSWRSASRCATSASAACSRCSRRRGPRGCSISAAARARCLSG